MRFIHTGDWHLGRLFFGLHLTEDQSYVLDKLIEVAREARAQALVIAGDVYDRAVPPPEAVQLLDEVLSRFALAVGIPVLMIAGNHDSPERLGFGARLLAAQGVHVAGLPATGWTSPPTGAGERASGAESTAGSLQPLVVGPTDLVLHDEHGPVRFLALPYAEPAVVRACLADEAVRDHETAMQALLRRLGPRLPGERTVLVTHAFVQGGLESESERPLSVGGAGAVSASLFGGFHYVALGHLHRPQSVASGEGSAASSGDPRGAWERGGSSPEAGEGHGRRGSEPPVPSSRVRYAGSLLKYSFSEAGHGKSVSLVDLDAAGNVLVEEIALTPRHDLRRVSGDFRDILAGTTREGPLPRGCTDYLAVALLDRGPVLDALARLREVYPNVVSIERPGLAPAAGPAGPRGDHRLKTDLELFAAFFEQTTGEALRAEERVVFTEIADSLRRAEREAPV